MGRSSLTPADHEGPGDHGSRREGRDLHRRDGRRGTNIVLVGFMGAGKSDVGRRLARTLGRPFFDADQVLEAQAGCSIPTVFQREGEEGFRRRERHVIRQLTRLRGSVIATGGGAVMDPANWAALRQSGVTVWLDAPLDVLLGRVMGEGKTAGDASSKRPLLARGREALAALYAARQPLYARADLTVPTAAKTPDEVVDDLVAALQDAGLPDEAADTAIRLMVDLGERSYPIWIGEGLLPRLGPLLQSIGIGSRLLVVTQPNLDELYGSVVMDSLREAGFQPHRAMIPGGESFKTLQTVRDLYDDAVDASLDRGSAVLALGGGVVGDVAGMVAATFMRGIDFIQVPTTLLAQVDAAVGGKVGVNLPQGKNMVGAFHQPRAVITDTHTLLTLPEREFAAGMAEVVKYGFIADPSFLALLEAQVDDILEREPEALAMCIRRSCEIKADIVRADEREHNVRAWLNLGHTFAHGIEAASSYGGLLHGEAVSVGMVAAMRLSRRLGWLSEEQVQRGEALLARLGLPLQAEGVPIEAAWEAMGRDKKTRDGHLHLVLLRDWGEPHVTDEVPVDLARWALESVCEPNEQNEGQGAG